MAEPSLGPQDYESGTEGDENDIREKEGGLLSFLGELPVLILTAIIVAWVIKSFLVQPFFIPSSSMEPTLLPGDRVLVSKLSYRLYEPQVGNVIVFKAPEQGDEQGHQDFIKRIVATQGMEVEVVDGQLIVDGKKRKELFIRRDLPTSRFGPFTVPLDAVFVMGDNRANSKDSRFFGPVEKESIIGKTFVLYWPFDRVGPLN